MYALAFWSPLLCRWLLRGRGSTWCSARAPMYALASLGLRWLLRGRRGAWCSARGRMYALASLGLRWLLGGRRRAGALQGVGCTPWRPFISAAPLLFAWQAQHSVLCKGSDVRPGVPWSPLLFCVAGAALGAVQGVGCTPWRFGLCALPVAFAWQGQQLVLCKGSDVRPGLRWLLHGRRGTWCSESKGSDVRPGVPWSPVAFTWQARHLVLCKAAGFCVAGAAFGALQGVGCTPWRPLISGGFCVAGVALGALQGVGCMPWRPLVSAALPVAFAWQGPHLVLCKGSDVRPGVPWSPLLCRWLLRGRRGTWCSASSRMCAVASLGLRCSAGGFCVAGAALGALQGVGCTPVPWSPTKTDRLRMACNAQLSQPLENLCRLRRANRLVPVPTFVGARFQKSLLFVAKRRAKIFLWHGPCGSAL